MKLSSILALLPFCAALAPRQAIAAEALAVSSPLVPRQAIVAEAVEIVADWAIENTGEGLEAEFDINAEGEVVHPSAGVEILHQNPLGNDLVRVVFKKVDEFLGLEGHAEIIYNRYTHQFRYFKSNSLQVIPGHTFRGLKGGTQVGNRFLPVARAFEKKKMMARQAIVADAIEVTAEWYLEEGAMEAMEGEFEINAEGEAIAPREGVTILHQNPLGNDLVKVVLKKIDNFLGLEGHAEIIVNRATGALRSKRMTGVSPLPGHVYRGIQHGQAVNANLGVTLRAIQ